MQALLELLILAAGFFAGYRWRSARAEHEKLHDIDAYELLTEGPMPPHSIYCQKKHGVWTCHESCDYRTLRAAIAADKHGLMWTEDGEELERTKN